MEAEKTTPANVEAAPAAAAAATTTSTGWLPKVILALDALGAIVAILIIITTIANMVGLPIFLGVFPLPVFSIPWTCDGLSPPTSATGCLTAYLNARWQIGVFSFMILVAAFVPIMWVFRSVSQFGAIHDIRAMIDKTPMADAAKKITIIFPIITWFSLGIATLGMAGILGFAVGLICICLCFLYIIFAFFE